MYHLRPPTRVRNVELIKYWEPKKVTDSPLRHHHLKTADIPRRGDLYTGRIPMLFNQDVIAYRARPAKAYDKFQYYKNGGADEIIFVFHGSGVMESVFGKLPYRAEDYIVIPRGITYRLVPDKIEEEDYLILESVGPVRIPQRYLNHEGQIKMGAPYSERDLHGPREIITVDKEEDVDILVKDGLATHAGDYGASSVRCGRLGWLSLSVHFQRTGFRADHRHAASTATDSSDIRDPRICGMHVCAAHARYASGSRKNSVGARQRRGGRGSLLRTREFWFTARDRERFNHIASTRDSARATSGDDRRE